MSRCLVLGDSGDPFSEARRADLIVLATSIAPEATHGMGTKRLRAHANEVAAALRRLEGDFDEHRTRRAAEARQRAEIEDVNKRRELARLEAEHEAKFTHPGRLADPRSTFARADPDEAAHYRVLGTEPFRPVWNSAPMIGPVRVPNAVDHGPAPAILPLSDLVDASRATEAAA
jgi:hypothetical protein